MNWNTNLYDQKHDFVSMYGEALIDLLKPKEGEIVLDLGSGTGDLAALISKSGARVVGMDSSEEMVKKSKEKYPGLDFGTGFAEDFHFEEKFDAVFSNATLHWVLEKEKAVDCIYGCLKEGGRFVAELGGRGNVQNIVSAIRNSLKKRGYENAANRQIWYFPSLSEYTSLLENKGFRVTWAAHFDRDTLLKDNDGIRNWIYMFGKSFFEDVDNNLIPQILTEVEEQLRPTNFKNNQWYADYVRLRVVAVK
ncbi:MAG: methyltransferase domain-containing protein [Bacteroidia bacterium]